MAHRWQPRSGRWWLALTALVLITGSALVLEGRPLALATVSGVLRLRFRDVAWLNGARLQAWREDPGRIQPVLFDVRTAPEFATSHLADANRMEPGAPLTAAVLALPRDTPIVVYCAVGYRSGLAARALRGAGFTRVWNLTGSLYAWADAGRPMVSAGGPATLVHPYGGWWGLLLDPSRRGN
jgi:rhodanese-related sulfurtransferase